MLTARSIPNALWASARERLIFYFRRRGVNNAEDLTQDTLMAVWRREDYQFEKEDDFFKVCYGFARHIQRAKHRDQTKHMGNELDDPLEPAIRGVRRLEQTEMRLLLKETLSVAATELAADELALIGAAVDRDGNIVSARNRVALHRVRRKLAKLTGWRT